MNRKSETDTHGEKENTTIFFSYSRVDQEQALHIIAAIESAGYKVWWDGMLEVGTNFLETTEHALESAKAVVVLWSKTSVKSHWVRDEAMSGRVRDRLVPLSLDGTVPPLGFRQVQFIDFTGWDHSAECPIVQEMHRTLATLHGDAPTTQFKNPSSPTSPFSLSRRKLVLGAAGAGAASLGVLAFTGKLFSSQTALLSNGIAVLPFENSSTNPDADYLASGLSSEIRTGLARNQSLLVVASSSSKAIAKQPLGAQEMAKQLGVGNILEGSVKIADNMLRVTASLINGKTGFSRWNDDFSRPLDDLLSVQRAITEALIGVLTTQTSHTEFDPEGGGTQNAIAFNEYIKGKALFRSSSSRASNFQALAHMDSAVQLDPKFGSAHAARARILLWLGITSLDSKEAQDYQAGSIIAAKLAVEISPNFPTAYSTLGYVLTAQLKLDEARRPYEQSRERGYGSAAIMARYSTYMAATGKNAEAISAIRRALQLDPLNPTIHRTAGLVYYVARQYENAISASNRALALAPDHWNAKSQIGMSLIYLGRVDEAIKACETESNQMERLPCLAIGHFKLGDISAANQAMSELVEKYGDNGAYQQAQILSEWGQLDKAMQILALAERLKDSGLALAGLDPALDPLRERADFLEILARLGFNL